MYNIKNNNNYKKIAKKTTKTKIRNINTKTSTKQTNYKENKQSVTNIT